MQLRHRNEGVPKTPSEAAEKKRPNVNGRRTVD
jgi:hypothetical protein